VRDDGQALRFSVLIPLEAHRGQALEAVRLWCEQTFPRNSFELVVVAPPGHAAGELTEIRRLLAPHDRLAHGVSTHDMGLCVEAAALAQGELLFFTEAHVLPEPDTLTRADAAAAEHPEWSGFSCRSIAIAPNRLAGIEAEFYERDIEFGMTQHPWRKVLDQCFVVYRRAYERAGGFDAQFGHFAEWLLAARLHVLDEEIGYAPAVAVYHFYGGRYREWRRFTEDFVRGQMAYLALEPPDELIRLFGEVPEWSSRRDVQRSAALRISRMLLDELPRTGIRFEHWDLLATWLWRVVAGPSAGLLRARVRRASASAQLRLALSRKNDSAAMRHLVVCCERIAEEQGLKARRRWARGRRGTDLLPSSSGRWQPWEVSEQPAVGFHLASGHGDEAIRWSQPAAYVELALPAGRSIVSLHWLFQPPVPSERRLVFYIDERRIDDTDVRILDDRVEIAVDVREAGRARVGWVCSRHPAVADNRALGLPVRNLAWCLAGTVDAPLPYAA
jgi:GT2 family glycosyltransferase